MIRQMVLAIAAVTLLAAGPVSSGPVGDHMRLRDENNKRLRLLPGVPLEIPPVIFRGNERACAIVEGDHNPPMKMTIEVRDPTGKVVTSRTGVDFVAAIWYPPRTQPYRIIITGDGSDFNDLEIVLK